MAAQYTEVTLEDMEKFLKRGFRALRPKQGVSRSEYYYDLDLGQSSVIRVWTSVQRGSGTGADVGQDAIRVQILNLHTKKPLMSGKAPIVKRTQGWRNSLQEKIEDLLEAFESNQHWDAPAPAPGTPAEAPTPRVPGGGPTDKQVNFIKLMMSRASANRLEAAGVFERFRSLEWPFSEENIRRMTGREISGLIDALKTALGWSNRYADEYSYNRNGVD